MNYLKWWVRLNWLPLLIGGLVVLSLLVLLLSRWRAKRRNVVPAERAKQPPVATAATKADAAEQTTPKTGAVAAAYAFAASTPSESARIRTSLGSPSAEQNDHSDEQEEREVFEI